MNDETIIRLTVGLGDLVFGATREQARSYLGEPDEVSSDGDPGDTSVAWYYWSRRLSVHFDEDDDFRLGTIETSSPVASLNGKCLIGMSKPEVLNCLSGLELDEPAEELNDLEDKGDSRGCLLSFNSHSLNLWFEDSVLTEIQWDYLIDANDEIVWPKDQRTSQLRLS